MSNPIRNTILQAQLNKCNKRYEKLVESLTDPYSHFIREMEEKGNAAGQVSGKKAWEWLLSAESFARALESGKRDAIPNKWFALCLSEGEFLLPSKKWRKFLKSDSDAGMAYGDEDMKDTGSGARYGAWFKPDYSPDTLLSFFYFGSLVFLNGRLVRQSLAAYDPVFSGKEATPKQWIYDFILFFTTFLESNHKSILHIPEILFHGKGGEWEAEDPMKPEVVNEEAYWGYEPDYDWCKMAALNRKGDFGYIKKIEHCGRLYHVSAQKPEPKGRVSVIIPSKDNVDVLSVCITSIYKETRYKPGVEVIVVDNGSNGANRVKVERLRETYNFTYLYAPMEFNFSRMCNLGASRASGSYLLFLNDDVEILQQDWLTVLAGQARVKNVGAVGAKLLYPDSDLIQHVGVTNLPVGPAHKLLKEHDGERDYYYGRNVLPYNVIGVTGACLMVAKEKFLEAGGFTEDIPVSYNDVDLCFALFEKGYQNVVRNDVVLYHHESISRGDDYISDEKWDRLLTEKGVLYERHPLLKGKDPYYNINLAGYKHKYFCSYLYPYEKRDNFSVPRVYKEQIEPEWHNECLTITLEHVKTERKLDILEEENAYLIEGWAYVLNMDNSRYDRTMLLQGEDGTLYELDIFDRYRQDVVDILPEQTNVGISGFVCRIRKDALPSGNYKVALLYKDRCSRQRLYRECPQGLVVE
ncbi:MAG: glycosyltransferase [Lachnospiraceae bacterium]|nr:glycosyltransferase [Lachnospiraceae bacterium]